MAKNGKSKGKMTFSIALAVAGAFLGAGTPVAGWSAFTGAMTGLSIGSTLWTLTHKQELGKFDSDYSNDDYARFNQVTNDVNQDAIIPIIYGTRKFGGLQTWYNTYNGSRNLEKDVVICCAGIDSVYNVCANEELIKDDTNISIYNEQYRDAVVWRTGNTLHLEANGEEKKYTLGNVKDYNAQTSLLSTIIDKIKSEAGNGWKIDGAVDDRTSKGISANSMKFKASDGTKNCYVDPLDKERRNAVVLDDRGYSIGTYEFHQNEAPDNYMDVGGYSGCAWIRSNLIASSRLGGSNPTINTYVKGMKVKVWKNNQWVTEYSENPAWIIRDFITNKEYGVGDYITEDMLDIPSFIEVANYCDELITYKDFDGSTKTCPRYTLNIILDSRKEPIEHLSTMLATFGGFFTIGNKIALKVEKAETPVYAFDDDTIVKDSMSITQTALDDTPNRYRIGYFDPNQSWTEVKVVVEDLELQHDQDEQINEKSVSLAGCTSQNQALRLGRLYRDINKVCSLTCSFSVATQGMMLECGDVITVSYRDIFTNMPFRITEIQETKNGTYQLSCRQYNPSIYDDSLGATVVNPSYSDIQSALTEGVPVVTNLTITEENNFNTDNSLTTNIVATWDDNKFANFSSYLVSISTDGVNYKSVANTHDNVIRIPNCNVGESYYVCVQNLNNVGLTSVPTISTIHLIGDGITPTTPTNLRIALSDMFTIKWDKINNTNIKHYEVRTDDNYGSDTNLLGRVENNELTTNLVTSRSGTIYVYAVSVFNVRSVPAQLTYNYPAIRVTNLNVTAKLQGIDLSVGSIPQNYLGVHWFIDGGSYDYDYRTVDSSDFYSCGAGVYNVNACYYDYFGEAAKYDTTGTGKTVTVSVYIDPDLLDREKMTEDILADSVQATLAKAESAIQETTMNTAINNKATELTTNMNSIKSAIEKNLTDNYLTTTQTNTAIDTKIGNYDPTTKMGNYYTKTETASAINTTLASYNVISSSTGAYVTNVYTKTETDSKITTELEKLDITGKLTNYYTKSETATQISTSLGSYVKSSDLTNTLKDYSTTTQTSSAITTALGSYYTKDEVNGTNGLLKSYYTKTETSNEILAQMVSNNLLNKKADGSYEVAVMTESKTANQISTSLSSYLKTSDLNTQLQSTSTITQMNNAIDLRVQTKDYTGENVITKLNGITVGTDTVKIQGGLIHITGDTKIDGNVISSGMIQSNAITTDKLNVSSLSSITATIGTLRTKTSGARIEIKDNLIEVYDENNTLRVRLGVWD